MGNSEGKEMKHRLLLSEEQAKEVKEFIRSTEKKREYRRAQVVLLVAEGHFIAEAARVCGLSYTTAKNCVARYKERGVESFIDLPRSGRPRKIQDEHKGYMESCLERSPRALGWREYGWNCGVLRRELERKFGLKVVTSAVWRALAKEGYRFRRPKLHIGSPDPEYGHKKR
jgi:transposase